MDPTGLQDFVALTGGRSDAEIAHVLAVLTAASQHMDQQKEKPVGKVERIKDDDVIVHHTKGCDLDGRRDEHLHTQVEHRAHVDQVGARMREQGWGRR